MYIFRRTTIHLRLEIMEYTYQFTHAIVRQPAKSIIKGLRAVDIGLPDYAQMMSDQIGRAHVRTPVTA